MQTLLNLDMCKHNLMYYHIYPIQYFNIWPLYGIRQLLENTMMVIALYRLTTTVHTSIPPTPSMYMYIALKSVFIIISSIEEVWCS